MEGHDKAAKVIWSPSAGAKSGFFTTQSRQFKAFGEILVAEVSATIHWAPQPIKGEPVRSKNSQFLAIVGNLSCLTRY